jgi:hypothetical protein
MITIRRGPSGGFFLLGLIQIVAKSGLGIAIR